MKNEILIRSNLTKLNKNLVQKLLNEYNNVEKKIFLLNIVKNHVANDPKLANLISVIDDPVIIEGIQEMAISGNIRLGILVQFCKADVINFAIENLSSMNQLRALENLIEICDETVLIPASLYIANRGTAKSLTNYFNILEKKDNKNVINKSILSAYEQKKDLPYDKIIEDYNLIVKTADKKILCELLNGSFDDDFKSDLLASAGELDIVFD